MKEMVYERLKLLAAEQEKMIKLADKLELCDKSQLFMEKCIFEAINASDKVTSISREGEVFVKQLQEHHLKHFASMCDGEEQKATKLFKEIQNNFLNISEASTENNDLSHKMETEAIYQKALKDEIRDALMCMRLSIDNAAAFIELILADI